MYFIKFFKSGLYLMSTMLFFSMTTFAQSGEMSASNDNSYVSPQPVPQIIPSATALNQYDLVIEKELWYDPTLPSYILIEETALIDNTDKKAGILNLPTNVDRGPIYTLECVNAADPQKCSNEKIAAAIKDNIEYPDRAERREHDGK